MKPSSFPNSITAAAAAVVAAATKDHDDGSIATEYLDYSNSSTATAASASKYNIEDATTRDATRNTKKQTTSAVTATEVDHDDTAKPADGSLSPSLPSSFR